MPPSWPAEDAPRAAADPAAPHPARRARRADADRPARDRLGGLGGQHRPVRDAARDPRRVPDAGDADRRHRPVGRDGRVDDRLPRGDPVPLGRRAGRASRSASARPSWSAWSTASASRVFRVQPLIMTLATGLVAAGFLTVYQTATVATTSSAPPFVPGSAAAVVRVRPEQPAGLRSRSPRSSCSCSIERVRAAAVRGR